jgi:predicted transposase YdaD
MTAAQRLIKKGMQKGIYQRNLRNSQDMLKEGCDISFIAKVTNLSRETIEALKT